MTGDLRGALVVYRDGWAEAVRNALSSGQGTEARVEATDDGVETAGAEDLCWLETVVAGAPEGRQGLAIARASVRDLARLLSGSDTDSASGGESVIDDPLQVLADEAGRVLSQDRNLEVSFTAPGSARPEWEPSVSFAWRIDGGSTRPMTLFLCLDEALATTLSEIVPAAGTAGETDITVSMLSEVAIPATMRLGETELTVSDMLAFGAGAAQVVEPPYGKVAELAVGGRVMARGEIVLVSGNYGLRVTELAAEGARLAILSHGDLAE